MIFFMGVLFFGFAGLFSIFYLLSSFFGYFLLFFNWLFGIGRDLLERNRRFWFLGR